MNTTMDYGRREAQPEPAPAVDWTRVAKRAIRLIALFGVIAGLGLGVLAVRQAIAGPHRLNSPVEPHGAVVPLIVSHRGYTGTGCTENTVCAVNAAADHGTDMVETDVRFTRDSIPVISHDATIDRTTTGHGAVSAMSAARFLRQRSRHGGQPATLHQFLSAAQARRLPALVELKTVPTAAQMRRFAAAVPAAIRPKVTVQSFLPAAVGRARAAGWPVVQLLNHAGHAPAAAQCGGVAVQYRALTTAAVRRLHADGLGVFAWTVDTRSAWQRLARADVDGLITNKDPRAVKAALA